KVAGDLRLTYSAFEDLEAYTRFGTRLDEDTRRTLERGQRIREILKQPQFEPISSSEQIAVLLAVTSGLLDTLPLKEVASAKDAIRKALRERQPEIIQKIESGERLSEEDRDLLLKSFRDALGG
ncbi:MAG: F0F1 ATP synthase subunit alpha, partial [Methanothrix sp.]|nr:F0F1 ATP synthase subunit alpha [Methanothrix sp.]